MRSRSFNIPNLLSLTRILLAPFVMVLLLYTRVGRGIPFLRTYGFDLTYCDLAAALVFIIAALTDTADGYIARQKGLITNLGKFIDPLSDKVLVMAALIALLELGRLSGWMVMCIVARDFMVSGLRMAAATQGEVIAASKLGKLKTVFQIIAIIMMILKLPFALWVMYVSIFLTVWSGFVYVANGWKMITDSD